MASTPADAATNTTGKSGGKMWLVSVVVLTLLGGGGGWFIGTQIVAMTKGGDTLKPKETAVAPPPSAYSGDMVLKELPPIVTNLAVPEGAWIRLQVSVIYDKKTLPDADATVLMTRITDDLLAFVKTLSAPQIQGASGLQHLREDLNERAGLRSDGQVKELMIETLVLQ